MIICPYCGSRNVIYDPDRGEYVCRVCGSVITEIKPVMADSLYSYNDNSTKWLTLNNEGKRIMKILKDYKYLEVQDYDVKLSKWISSLSRIFNTGVAKRLAEELVRRWRFKQDPISVIECLLGGNTCGYSMNVVKTAREVLEDVLGMDYEMLIVMKTAEKFKVNLKDTMDFYRKIKKYGSSPILKAHAAAALAWCHGDIDCALAALDIMGLDGAKRLLNNLK